MFKVHSQNQYDNNPIYIFQNISCLRFIKEIKITKIEELTFQNISCLRFMVKMYDVKQKNILISKHFMFKVHDKKKLTSHV